MIEYTVAVYDDGTKQWYLNGKQHREDGPAIEYANGNKFWYINDELHREDGPSIDCAGGGKHWYINGKLHREDGPAIEWASGGKQWYLNDELHREDGPACEWADGDKEWYLNDKEMSEEEERPIVLDLAYWDKNRSSLVNSIHEELGKLAKGIYDDPDFTWVTSLGTQQLRELSSMLLCKVT